MCIRDRNKWRDAIKSATHPSGFYVTGEVNIATQVSAQISSPVLGVSSGESDDPIFSIVNTLFTTVFGRRLGTVTDGTTKRTSLQVRTGENIDVSDDYNAVFSATTRDLDLKNDEKNVKIPGDYFIIGYDNILFSKIFFPKLTTINTNVDQLSSEALDYLMRMIKGQVQIGASAKKTLIPVELVVRDTDKRGKNDKHT